jgi:hypothetical protein
MGRGTGKSGGNKDPVVNVRLLFLQYVTGGIKPHKNEIYQQNGWQWRLFICLQ